jgi:phospholipase A-2-activating protein
LVDDVIPSPPIVQIFAGYAVTGGQDTVINIFSLDSPKDDPDFSLLGHTDNVCALDVTPGGAIISGSWDR